MSKKNSSCKKSRALFATRFILCFSFTIGAPACDDSSDDGENSSGSTNNDDEGEGSGASSHDDLTLPYVVYDYSIKYNHTSVDEDPISRNLNGEVVMEQWGDIDCSGDSNSVHLEYVSTIDECDAQFKVSIASAEYSGAGIYRIGFFCEDSEDSSYTETDAKMAIQIPVVYEGNCFWGAGNVPLRPVRGDFSWEHSDYCTDYNDSVFYWVNVKYSYSCELEIINHTSEIVMGHFVCDYTYNYTNDGESDGVPQDITDKATVEIDGEFAYNPAECE